jgi:hypothetical protein
LSQPFCLLVVVLVLSFTWSRAPVDERGYEASGTDYLILEVSKDNVLQVFDVRVTNADRHRSRLLRASENRSQGVEMRKTVFSCL